MPDNCTFCGDPIQGKPLHSAIDHYEGGVFCSAGCERGQVLHDLPDIRKCVVELGDDDRQRVLDILIDAFHTLADHAVQVIESLLPDDSEDREMQIEGCYLLQDRLGTLTDLTGHSFSDVADEDDEPGDDMTICEACGAEVDAESTLCPKCGADLCGDDDDEPAGQPDPVIDNVVALIDKMKAEGASELDIHHAVGELPAPGEDG